MTLFLFLYKKMGSFNIVIFLAVYNKTCLVILSILSRFILDTKLGFPDLFFFFIGGFPDLLIRYFKLL